MSRRAAPVRSQRARILAEKRGRYGEWVAMIWLRLRGWRVLARRLRTPCGEIDLIVRRGGTLAFVEVKTRMRADAPAIERRQLDRVVAAARLAMPRFASPRITTMRVDLMIIRPWRVPLHRVDVTSGEGS